MKILFRNIHLYLSLVAGLVVFTTCFTGAVLVFEEEFQHAFHKERYEVTKGDKKLPLSAQVIAVQTKYPLAKVTSIRVYSNDNRSTEMSVRMKKKQPESQQKKAMGANEKKGGSENERITAFVNPYTGEVLELYYYRDSFFFTIMSIHRWLLAGDVGKFIVGTCTLIFLFILITGVILWWPKTKMILVQRLRIKYNTGWKRLNHDLHMVLGFYSCIFLFVFAFTGLAWSFQWFNNGIYKVTNSPVKPPKAPSSLYTAAVRALPIDRIDSIAKQYVDQVIFYNISLPKDSVEAVAISSLSKSASHVSATDLVYIDQYSGKKIGSLLFSERSKGARVRATFRPVHTGSIFGLSSKLIALLACIFGASFPVTGTIMWVNRWKKKKK